MNMMKKNDSIQTSDKTHTKTGDAAGLVCAAAVLLLIFQKAAELPFNQTGKIHGLNYNLVVYAGAVLLAFFVYLAGSALERALFASRKSAAPEHRNSFIFKLLSAVLSALFFLAYLYKVYADEVNNFPESFVKDALRQKVSHPLYFAAVFFGALLLLIFIRTISRHQMERRHSFGNDLNPASVRSGKLSLFLRWSVILLISLFCAFLLWCPSPYYDMGGTMLHVHAYTNSIANVASFVPFSRLNLSIYGHYALFYLPLVKLLGGGYPAVALSISIFGFLTFFFAGYTAHKTIKNDILFYLTMAALAGTTTILNRRGQYYQINPHRLLMPALSLAYITWKEFHVKKENTFLIRLLELLIGIAAITWNLETGLFVICTISLSRILKQLSKDHFFSMPVWTEILLLPLSLLLSFFGAWGLTGLYNLTCGGHFESVRTFIYPLMSGNYNVNNLRLPLRGWTALNVIEILIFALTAFHLIRSAWLKERMDCLRLTAFAISVSGLMNMVYFINRTAYGNIQITHIQLVLLAGILAADVADCRFPLSARKKAPETSLFSFLISGVIYIGLFFLAVESVVSAPEAVTGRKSSHSQELSAAETWYSQIRDNVPANTFAYGVGMPEAYMSLGWDTGCHMIDFADPNDYNNAYLEKKISQQSAVLTTDANFAANHPEFKAQGSWTAYYCTATYYVRD